MSWFKRFTKIFKKEEVVWSDELIRPIFSHNLLLKFYTATYEHGLYAIFTKHGDKSQQGDAITIIRWIQTEEGNTPCFSNSSKLFPYCQKCCWNKWCVQKISDEDKTKITKQWYSK